VKIPPTNLEELLQYFLPIHPFTHVPDKSMAISYSCTLQLSPAATRDDNARPVTMSNAHILLNSAHQDKGERMEPIFCLSRRLLMANGATDSDKT